MRFINSWPRLFSTMQSLLQPGKLTCCAGSGKLVVCALSTLGFSATALVSTSAKGQSFTVQLPTQGTFSIQSSVSVPDGGEMNLGGNVRYGAGSVQRGGAKAIGSSYGAANASVKATIIDLDELDRLIRSEANPRPIPVDWSKVAPPKVGNDFNHDQALPDRPPAYAYMMAMSTKPSEKKNSIEDARYYLSLASDARRRGHWTSVELYYQMAWDALPENRKQVATEAFVKAKEKKSEDEKMKKQPSNSKKTL
ncbi:MAG: hypothetical protein MUC83_04160 [Pirellula sp.]|jgi:hypothetical protein|nr:hypothetical protein [Pirellula sp.]